MSVCVCVCVYHMCVGCCRAVLQCCVAVSYNGNINTFTSADVGICAVSIGWLLRRVLQCFVAVRCSGKIDTFNKSLCSDAGILDFLIGKSYYRMRAWS